MSGLLPNDKEESRHTYPLYPSYRKPLPSYLSLDKVKSIVMRSLMNCYSAKKWENSQEKSEFINALQAVSDDHQLAAIPTLIHNIRDLVAKQKSTPDKTILDAQTSRLMEAFTTYKTELENHHSRSPR